MEPSSRFDLRSERALLLLLLLAGVLLSIVLAPHYGQSWDDEFDADKGRNALQAYLGSPAYLTTENQRYYGPLHFMLSEMAVRLAARLRAGWNPIDVRHVLNFASFLLALPALFLLARRVVGTRTCLILTSLFATQPLLFGHAFINQKDIPFMSAVLWSFFLGISAVEQRSGAKPSEPGVAYGEGPPSIGGDWRGLRSRSKTVIGVLLLAGIYVILDLFSIGGLRTFLSNVLTAAYDGRAWAPIQRLFQVFAQDAYKTPLQLYLEKLELVLSWSRILIALLLLWAIAFALSRLLPAFPVSLDRLRREGVWAFAAAGVALGAATAIRVFAPFVGLLVAAYACLHLKRKAILPLTLYTVAAISTATFFWPFLWPNPIRNFLETLRVMSNFPAHMVLYRGALLPSDALPWHFLPSLLASQLTLPGIILFLFGVVVAATRIRSMRNRGLLVISALWLGVPALSVMLLRTPVYGNFRQLLFILPPMFILIGVGLEAVLPHLRAGSIRAILLAIILLPGIAGIVQLHPYEYAFYNLLVGGTSRVEGRYELDYWCTGYREAALYLNREAAQGSTVVVAGPEYGVRNFIKPGIKIYPDWDAVPNPDYAVACDQALIDGFYHGYEIAHRVTRGGAVFALVRKGSP